MTWSVYLHPMGRKSDNIRRRLIFAHSSALIMKVVVVMMMILLFFLDLGDVLHGGNAGQVQCHACVRLPWRGVFCGPALMTLPAPVLSP